MSDLLKQGKNKLLQILILLVVALALTLGCLYPLKQLVTEDLEKQMSMRHERLTTKLQYSQPTIIPSFLELLAQPHILESLAKDQSATLERELNSFKLLEPRLNSAYWLGPDGNQKTHLLINEKNTLKKLQSELTSLILRAYQLPKGHSLLEMVATDSQKISLVLLHNLRNSLDKNLGVILLEFTLDDMLLELMTLEAENSPFSLLLVDSYSNIIATVGHSDVRDITRDDVIRRIDSFEFNTNFKIDGAAWYKKSIAPFHTQTTDVYGQMDWQVLIRMSEEQLNKTLFKAYVIPLVSILVVLAGLSWFVFKGVFAGFRRHHALNGSVNGQRIMLPEKMYEWSYEGALESSFYAPLMLMSIGYDFSRVNIFDTKLIEALVSEEDLERISHIKRDLKAGAELQFDIDLRLRHKLGYWVWFNVRGRVEERDKNGQIMQMRGVSIDITKRKQDEKMILSALQDADQANQLKSEFISNISHEVRTPINAILGYLQLMQDGANNQEYITKSREAINILLSRFNQIVVYSQLEHGALELDLQPVQITNVIDEIIADIKEQQLADTCTFNASIDSTLAQWYLLDADSFKLLVNLLVRTMAALGDIEQMTIVVVNSGRTKRAHTLQFELRADCDERLVNRLNAVFANTHDHSNHIEMGGSNIDLALARKLLERLNADLAIDNFNGGTSFVFTADLNIPDVYHRKHINQQLIIEKDSLNKPKIDIQGSRILIVEDNATNREVITQILGKMGVIVESAENGAIAVEKLRHGNLFNMVFMDLQMPVMDGLEATRVIRKELGLTELPIVAVTANQFNIDRKQAVEAGMDDFIPKPVNTEQLRKAIVRWVGGERPHAELRPNLAAAMPTPTEPALDSSKAIDPEASKKRMAGDADMLQRIYKRFYSDFKAWDSQLNDMLAQQRWVEAKMHAHTLKGASGNIDAVKLAQLAADMEKRLSSSDVDIDQIQLLQSALSTEHRRVESAIQSYLAETSGNEAHETLDEASMQSLFSDFADLLERRKRMPQDQVDAIRATLVGTAREARFDAFIEAWRSFDFNAAKQALDRLSGEIKETAIDEERTQS